MPKKSTSKQAAAGKRKKAPSPVSTPVAAAIAKGGKEGSVLATLATSRVRGTALKPGDLRREGKDFTQEFADRACAMIERGVPQWIAFEANGVPRRTAKFWMDEMPEFCEQVETARAKVCAEIVQEIREAVTPGEFGVKDWKARAWAAAKLSKEDFGEEKGSTNVNVDVSLSAEMITSLIAAV